jgi:two-component system phosphate regulon sensor histidine kinase PhoR
VWTYKLFWKLFFVYFALVLGLSCGFLWIVSDWQREFAVDQAAESLATVARSLARTALGQESSSLREAMSREVKALSRETALRAVYFDAQGTLVAGEAVRDENLLQASDVHSAFAGHPGRYEQRLADHTLLHVALPVRSGTSLLGVVRVSRPLDDIDNRLAGVERTIWLFAAAVTGAMGLITYWVLGRIARPLSQLTKVAQALVANDERQLLAIESSDEFGILGDALNQMQKKLAGRVNQLKENTERLATVLGSMVEGVIAVSTSGSILLANEASRELLDMSVPDPVGRSLLEVTRSLPVHAAVVEAQRVTVPVQREFEAVGPTRRVLALRATRLPGEPLPGVMVVLHDISDVRRLENLRREFVANVSHELKTPLASIKAYAETLRIGALHDPEHAAMFVARIEEQAERLHQLILDLLQIARVESGQAAFEIADVDLAHVVEDCLTQYADAAAARQISLIVSPAATPVIVRGDEEGLRTIVSNLLDNAIKYTPPGGSVTVRWRKADPLPVLEVKDTGIGIAPKDQARVFERFFRADKARSREVGGTGLGLSIVKHLALAFGGDVGLESIPHQGSTFRVRLQPGQAMSSLPATTPSS